MAARFNTAYSSRQPRAYYQIPDIHKRSYPKEPAGELYPEGIPIYPEEKLLDLISDQKIDAVALSYSDLSHVDVMHRGTSIFDEEVISHIRIDTANIPLVVYEEPEEFGVRLRWNFGQNQATNHASLSVKPAGGQLGPAFGTSETRGAA